MVTRRFGFGGNGDGGLGGRTYGGGGGYGWDGDGDRINWWDDNVEKGTLGMEPNAPLASVPGL